MQPKLISHSYVCLFVLSLTVLVPFYGAFADNPFPGGSDSDALDLSERAIEAMQNDPETRSPLMKVLGKKNPKKVSKQDWLKDSLGLFKDFGDFVECFEPKLIAPFCSYCYPYQFRADGNFFSCPYRANTGYTFEYWWPEATIEINRFGEATIHPGFDFRPDLTEKGLVQGLSLFQRMLDMNQEKLPNYDAQGKSQLLGVGANDQSSFLEAKMYQPLYAKLISMQRTEGDGKWDFRWKKLKFGCAPIPFWYNGYKKGNSKVFLDTTPKKKPIIFGYTEEVSYLPYWRFPAQSANLDTDAPGYPDKGADRLYAVSPEQFSSDPFPTSTPRLGGRNKQFSRNQACASYRADTWPDRYGDLTKAVNVVANTREHQEDVCYKGGWDLYPLSGELTGSYGEQMTSAILTRRAIELMSLVKGINGSKAPLFGRDGRKSIDKLQRISPARTSCIGVEDIDDRNHSLFAPGALDPDEAGSVRYVYWNKRQGCACQYRGAVEPDDNDIFVPYLLSTFTNRGWGGQPFPCDIDDFGCWLSGPASNRDEFEDIGEGDFEEGQVNGIAPFLVPDALRILAPMFGVGSFQGLGMDNMQGFSGDLMGGIGSSGGGSGFSGGEGMDLGTFNSLGGF